MTARDIVPLIILLLTAAVLARAMIRVGIMDFPTDRKIHARPIPKAGGIAAIGTFLAAIPFFPVLYTSQMTWVLAGAFGLGLIGFLDDLQDRGVVIKLAAQTVAAILVVSQTPMHAAHWGLGGPILAVGWLIFITNTFNFMDGSDGLAGGAGLIAAVFLAATAPGGGPVQMGALALAAGLAGFLPFNLPPARLFLGDTGSQFCGFLLGALGLGLMQETATGHAFWLVPMVLNGMIVDVGITLVRRLLSGARITTAHREHLYQRCRLPAWIVAATHWGFAALGGMAWLLLTHGLGWMAATILALSQLAWLGFVRLRGVRTRP